MLAQVHEAEIGQCVPFDISADFPAHIAGPGMALRGRVQIAKPEVDLVKIVECDAAQGSRVH